MDAITSFSQRRPAAGSLPAFSLPPPNAEIPRTADGLSPSLSSVHTGGSQASLHHQAMNSYTFGGSSMQPSNANANNANNTDSNNTNNTSSNQPGNPNSMQPNAAPSWGSSWGNYPSAAQQPLPNIPFRQSISDSYSNPRTATGPDGLPTTSYDQSQQQHYATHLPNPMATAAPQHPGIMASSQPLSQPPLTAHSDSFAHAYAPTHSRPGSNPSYYASSGPSQFSYSSAHSSPTTSSPGAPRGIGSLPNMNYRYSAYNQQPLSGSVMSNMHHPGGQMSMITGQHAGYGAQMMYPHHAAPQPQSERPFKCDQCIQSFTRNHDLKRHKRIHLPIKPFPCTFCQKSFSRKDALKRHRLVKGCEAKAAGGEQNGDSSSRRRSRS